MDRDGVEGSDGIAEVGWDIKLVGRLGGVGVGLGPPLLGNVEDGGAGDAPPMDAGLSDAGLTRGDRGMLLNC
jgi:hypothetical protein